MRLEYEPSSSQEQLETRFKKRRKGVIFAIPQIGVSFGRAWMCLALSFCTRRDALVLLCRVTSQEQLETRFEKRRKGVISVCRWDVPGTKFLYQEGRAGINLEGHVPG